MLGLQGITKTFAKTSVLDGVTLEIDEGELFTIVGPSGCGKSTLLRLVCGLEKPDSGSVWIDGRDVTGDDPGDRGVGMVFQNYALFPHLSARDNVTFGLRARRHPKDDIARRLAEVAELLEMTPFLDRRPRQLSGGQRQRVALARALVRRPRVLLMDEPLSNVDALLRDRMRTELREFHDRAGVTTVYVTHDQREAMGMSDRLMVLAEGHVHQIGRPLEVFRRPTTAFAARFLGSPGTNLWPMTVEDCGDERLVVRSHEGETWILHGQATTGTGPHAPRAQDSILVPGGEVWVGVRPDKMVLDAGHRRLCGFDAKAVGVEPQGDTTLVRLRHGTREVMVFADTDDAPPIGSVVRVGMRPSDLSLFTSLDGHRLEWSPSVLDALDDLAPETSFS